jgi:glycosyltransferase involved in cell wall biosynthesis
MRACVLHLIDSFRSGGTERQAVQLAEMQLASGSFRVGIACLSTDGELLERARRASEFEIEEYQLKNFYGARTVRQLYRFVASLRRNRVSLIHTHDFYTNIFGMAAATLAGIPVRIASKRETGRVRTPHQIAIEKIAFRFSNKVIANSLAVKEALCAAGVTPEKIEVIHNGLNQDRFALTEINNLKIRESFGLPPCGRIVTLVANMRLAVKDQSTILDAARLILDQQPSTVFVLAGEGQLLEKYRAYSSSLGIADSVFFMGACDRLPELLAVSDVCVLSSRAEGFSNSILEYMAAARPVVVTDVGGAREAVVDGVTGYIVPPASADTMAEKVVALLSNSGLSRVMGLSGRERVTRLFSREAQLTATENLYRRLLSEGPAEEHNVTVTA